MQRAVSSLAVLSGSSAALINVPQPVLGHSVTVIKAPDHEVPVLSFISSYEQNANLVLNTGVLKR